MQALKKAKRIARKEREKERIVDVAEKLIALQDFNTPTLYEKIRVNSFGASSERSNLNLNLVRINSPNRKLEISVCYDDVVNALITYYSGIINESEI